MNTLWLRIRAPFAAYRWMQAGVYRATSPVVPPSAAWGLILNIAGIETRAAAVEGPTTLIDSNAPPLRLATGLLGCPERAVLYQQLHTYPVGHSGKADLLPRSKGSKFWIAPAKREFLVDFDCELGVQAGDDLLDRVRSGLAGRLPGQRYGLPFAGDNNLLFDRIDELSQPLSARWYERVTGDGGPLQGSCRLTVGIDRGDASRTTTMLFAPTLPLPMPPDGAWTWAPLAPRSA